MDTEAAARAFHIRIDRELTHPQVLSLLDEHLAGMRAASPPECVFALDLDGLRQPEITFLTASRLPADATPGAEPEEVGELIAMGALKELTPTTATEGGHGELKSMRSSARHLRQGAAQAILTELLTLARERGYARVSLESGSTPPFEPAMAMYRRFGFVECGPFADYREPCRMRLRCRACAGSRGSAHCAWHRRWLGGLYAWAGEYRNVNLSKGGLPFAAAAQVPRLMQRFEREVLAVRTPMAPADDSSLAHVWRSRTPS